MAHWLGVSHAYPANLSKLVWLSPFSTKPRLISYLNDSALKKNKESSLLHFADKLNFT